MRHVKTWLLLLVSFGLVSLLVPAAAFAISPSLIISLTNQQRQAAGLQPLQANSDLMSSSLAKANDMIIRDYWAHYAPDGTSPWYFISQSGYKYRGAGENLAMDFGDDQSVVAAWMASPSHRANILNPAYRDIGVAVVQGMLLGHETTLVVAHYGIPAVAPSAVTAPAPAQPPEQSVNAPVPVLQTAQPAVKAAQISKNTSAGSRGKPQANSAMTMFKLSIAQMWLIPFVRTKLWAV